MRTHAICLALAIVLLCPFASAQWTRIGLAGRSVTDITVSDNVLFAVTGDSGSVYRTTNAGGAWETILSRGVSHAAISHSTGTVFATSRDTSGLADTVCRSTNRGMNWERSATSIGGNWFTVIEIGSSGTVFCGREWPGPKFFGDHLAQSTDDGLTWSPFPYPGRFISIHGEDIAIAGYTGSGGGGGGEFISISTDGGRTWAENGLALWPDAVSALAWNSAGIYVGSATGGWMSEPVGLFFSKDTCRSLMQISTLIPTSLLVLPSSGTLAATNGKGVYYFSDNGDSLGSRNVGLTSFSVYRLAIDSAGYVYAGTGDGVFRIPMSQLTGVQERNNGVPGGFKLEQNYPNPFNPATTIRYSLPHKSQVLLTVYNTLGQQVATLVQGQQEAGSYEVQFDGYALASGVYFYRIQAGTFVATKKLILMK